MNIDRWEIILFYIGIYFGVNELFLLFIKIVFLNCFLLIRLMFIKW